MLIQKNVVVGVNGKNRKHYRNLGYLVDIGEKITIPIEHLSEGSHCRILVLCDYCEKSFYKEYKQLINQRKNSYGDKDCCKECIHSKTKETMIEKHGVENGMMLESTVEKLRETFLQRYGVDWNTKDSEIRNKAKMAQINMSEEKKNDKKEKARLTMLSRYGVESPLQMQKTRENLNKTLDKGSSQQNAVFKIISSFFGDENVFKNEPFSFLALDILLIYNGKLLDIEYDSSYWHDSQMDRKRDEFLKSHNFKILRIKSGRKIPEESLLIDKIFEILESENNYFEIILDDWDENQYASSRRGE